MSNTGHSDTDTFVTHLECSLTGKHYAHYRMRYLSDDGAPLLVRYDLAMMRGRLDRDAIAQRHGDLWMWRELLPLANDVEHVTLGEAITPVVPIRPDRHRGTGIVLIKDEGKVADRLVQSPWDGRRRHDGAPFR